jgi:hypothetical protein
MLAKSRAVEGCQECRESGSCVVAEWLCDRRCDASGRNQVQRAANSLPTSTPPVTML